VAGDGKAGYSGDDGLATLARVYNPSGVDVDALGNIYISDKSNNRIRMVTKSTGVITTVAGDGTAGYSGDGGQATSAQLHFPDGIAVDASGNIYISDTLNFCIRLRTASTGIITTVAGDGKVGNSGNGGLATDARMTRALGIAVDASGNMYFADQFCNTVRMVSSTGAIIAVAGDSSRGPLYGDDGGPAITAGIFAPRDVAVDASGNVYICESYKHRIRMVRKSTGIITTVYDSGSRLSNPYSVVVDSLDNLYITQGGRDGDVVIKVTKSTGIITTVAGYGTAGSSGDGGQTTSARLNFSQSVAVDASGTIYIADTSNNRIRMIRTTDLPTSPSASPTLSPSAEPTSTPSPSTIPATSLVATTSTSSSTALSTNALSGVIGGVGGFLLILLLLAVICLYRRR
jgi:trimeric autotransporter adhesin